MPKKINVLVVDDSAFMRRAIKQMLETDPDIEVLGTARDGAEGVEMAVDLKPDVITMDIEMPRMNGLEATEIIMEKAPAPILVVSSITKEGAQATFDALDKGAADYISKNLETSALDLMKIQKDLITKVKAVARKKRKFASLSNVYARTAPAPRKRSFATQKIAMVAIGASTGGPRAIQAIVTNLPKDLPTTFVVVVHMPKAFTGAFAERLNGLSEMPVTEARNGQALKPGAIFLSPGGLQTKIRRKGLSEFSFSVNGEPSESIYKPSVDVTMASVADAYPGRAMGVILTGMGHDGREGMRAIKDKGGKTLVQNEETCTVYGMPKSVIAEGLADKVVPLDMMAAEIVNMI